MIKTTKVSLTIFMIVAFMFSVSNVPVANVVAGVNNAGTSCNSPTTTLTIAAAPSGKDSDVSYNTTTLSVNQGVCFTLKFVNKAPSQEHSFVIDKTSKFAGVDMSLANNTAGVNGTDYVQTNLQAPSSAMDLTFYCDVPGHKSAGMQGTLHIVNPSASKTTPGFTLGITAVSLLSVFIVASIIRRRKIKVINY